MQGCTRQRTLTPWISKLQASRTDVVPVPPSKSLRTAFLRDEARKATKNIRASPQGQYLNRNFHSSSTREFHKSSSNRQPLSKMPPSVDFPPSLSFVGQAVLITGGSTGLGLETAIHYVALGASPVIITARNAARGAEAVSTIEARTGKKGIVQVRPLDMDSFSEVKKFVEGLENEVKTIDLVLLNAGCFAVDYKLSPEGWEQDLQVNTLSTALLALLLLPWMRAVKQPGILQHLGIVGSGNHTKVDIVAPEFPKKDVLKHFNDQKHYQGGRPTYALSKLLVHYAALEVAKLAVQPDGRYS
jgi:NAD(P)-dependent dehydrogenase (short-subunit alcohol dehydrogenase family)